MIFDVDMGQLKNSGIHCIMARMGMSATSDSATLALMRMGNA